MRISDWSSDVCSSDLNAFYRTAPFRKMPDRFRPQSGPYPRGGIGTIGQGKGCAAAPRPESCPKDRDRKSVVEGKGVSVRVDIGGRRSIKKKNNTKTN